MLRLEKINIYLPKSVRMRMWAYFYYKGELSDFRMNKINLYPFGE